MARQGSLRNLLWAGCLPVPVAAAVALAAGADRHAVFFATSLCAGVAVAVAVRIHRPPLRLPWLAASVGLLTVAAGRLTEALELDLPSDVFYLVAYSLLAFAIGVFLVRRGVTVESAVDVAIVFLSLSLIWWVALLGPRVSDPQWIEGHTLLLVYPVFDVALLAGLIGLVLSPGPRPGSYLLLLVALAFQFLTDTVDVRMNLDVHHSAPPLWLELGWVLPLVLLAASALHPTMVDVGAHPHSESPGLSRRRLRLFAFLSAAGVMLTIFTAPPGLHFSTIVSGGAAGLLVALMFLRLWLMTQRAESQVELVTRHEEMLRANERRLERLLENSPDAVALLDAEGTIVEVTSSPLRSSVPGDTAIGKLSFDYIHDDDKPLAAQAFERSFAEPGATLPLTLRVNRADGGIRWLDLSVTNLLDDPSVGALVINYRDVTERVELEAALNESQKMEALGRLAGGIAHDFNNVLSVIQGYARFAHDEADDESLRKDLDEVLLAADRAARLVSQLLTFAKPSASEETVELHDAIRRSVSLLRRSLGEDVKLEVELADGEAPIRLTPSQLDQILLNLAVNARDAMPSGGILTMRSSFVAGDADLVELVVEDTGTGVPEDRLDQIFEPFFTTKEQGKGTGLGLATIYGIVKSTGGTVEAANRPSGGARFRIRLPLQPAVNIAVSAPAEAVGTTPPLRVLLVEDEEGVRAALRRILEGDGHTVVDARDPSVALTRFRADPSAFDLLVTDIVMPVMSGVDLFERLSRLAPDLKVVYVTGYADDAIKARGMATSGGQILSKPFTPEGVKAAVARAVYVGAS